MCVALFTLDHPDYALCVACRFFRSFFSFFFAISILCSNRDEYLSRPTQPAAFHSFGGQPVLSGIDVRAGGTWLGLTQTGKLALL